MFEKFEITIFYTLIFNSTSPCPNNIEALSVGTFCSCEPTKCPSIFLGTFFAYQCWNLDIGKKGQLCGAKVLIATITTMVSLGTS